MPSRRSGWVTLKARSITCPLCLRPYTRPWLSWLWFGTPVAHPKNHPDCMDGGAADA